MHLNVGATSHKIEEEEEEVVHQKTSEATMGKPSFLSLCILVIKLMLFLCSIVTVW